MSQEIFPTFLMLDTGEITEVYYTTWTQERDDQWMPDLQTLDITAPGRALVFETPAGCYQMDLPYVQPGDTLTLSGGGESGRLVKCEIPRHFAEQKQYQEVHNG